MADTDDICGENDILYLLKKKESNVRLGIALMLDSYIFIQK